MDLSIPLCTEHDGPRNFDLRRRETLQKRVFMPGDSKSEVQKRGPGDLEMGALGQKNAPNTMVVEFWPCDA